MTPGKMKAAAAQNDVILSYPVELLPCIEFPIGLGMVQPRVLIIFTREPGGKTTTPDQRVRQACSCRQLRWQIQVRLRYPSMVERNRLAGFAGCNHRRQEQARIEPGCQLDPEASAVPASIGYSGHEYALQLGQEFRIRLRTVYCRHQALGTDIARPYIHLLTGQQATNSDITRKRGREPLNSESVAETPGIRLAGWSTREACQDCGAARYPRATRLRSPVERA